MNWKTEVLGHTIRVIDEEGNDVVVVGSVANPENIKIANLLSAAPNLKDDLEVVYQLFNSFQISLPRTISDRIGESLKKAEGKCTEETKRTDALKQSRQ